MTIPGLVSGVYSVSAFNVSVASSIYTGSVSGSPANVVNGAASIVTVIYAPPPPPPPAISNLRSQIFYCTRAAGNTTNYKFKFDVNSAISGFEVYLTNWAGDTPPATPAGVGGPIQGPQVDNTPVNAGSFPVRAARAVQITSAGSPDDAPTLGGFVGVVSVKPQAIGVTQATLWVRAILPDGTRSAYLASKDGMVSSSDSATCNTPIGSIP